MLINDSLCWFEGLWIYLISTQPLKLIWVLETCRNLLSCVLTSSSPAQIGTKWMPWREVSMSFCGRPRKVAVAYIQPLDSHTTFRCMNRTFPTQTNIGETIKQLPFHIPSVPIISYLCISMYTLSIRLRDILTVGFQYLLEIYYWWTIIHSHHQPWKSYQRFPAESWAAKLYMPIS